MGRKKDARSWGTTFITARGSFNTTERAPDVRKSQPQPEKLCPADSSRRKGGRELTNVRGIAWKTKKKWKGCTPYREDSWKTTPGFWDFLLFLDRVSLSPLSVFLSTEKEKRTYPFYSVRGKEVRDALKGNPSSFVHEEVLFELWERETSSHKSGAGTGGEKFASANSQSGGEPPSSGTPFPPPLFTGAFDPSLFT